MTQHSTTDGLISIYQHFRLSSRRNSPARTPARPQPPPSHQGSDSGTRSKLPFLKRSAPPGEKSCEKYYVEAEVTPTDGDKQTECSDVSIRMAILERDTAVAPAEPLAED